MLDNTWAPVGVSVLLDALFLRCQHDLGDGLVEPFGFSDHFRGEVTAALYKSASAIASRIKEAFPVQKE